MLVICVGTDILPAISLAYEDAELDVMIRRPRTKEEHLVSRKLITHAYLQMGWITCAGGFFGYYSTMYRFGFSMMAMFGMLSINPAIYDVKYTYMWNYNNADPFKGNNFLNYTI